MEIIEIPFDPNDSKDWAIPIPGDGEKHFSSREEAIAFAFNLSKSEKYAKRERLICVEGGDGRWRVFTGDFQPVEPPV